MTLVACGVKEQNNSLPIAPFTSGYAVRTVPESAPLSRRRLAKLKRSVPGAEAVTVNQRVFESWDFVQECTGSDGASVAPLVFSITAKGSDPMSNAEAL